MVYVSASSSSARRYVIIGGVVLVVVAAITTVAVLVATRKKPAKQNDDEDGGDENGGDEDGGDENGGDEDDAPAAGTGYALYGKLKNLSDEHSALAPDRDDDVLWKQSVEAYASSVSLFFVFAQTDAESTVGARTRRALRRRGERPVASTDPAAFRRPGRPMELSLGDADTSIEWTDPGNNATFTHTVLDCELFAQAGVETAVVHGSVKAPSGPRLLDVVLPQAAADGAVLTGLRNLRLQFHLDFDGADQPVYVVVRPPTTETTRQLTESFLLDNGGPFLHVTPPDPAVVTAFELRVAVPLNLSTGRFRIVPSAPAGTLTPVRTIEGATATPLAVAPFTNYIPQPRSADGPKWARHAVELVQFPRAIEKKSLTSNNVFSLRGLTLHFRGSILATEPCPVLQLETGNNMGDDNLQFRLATDVAQTHVFELVQVASGTAGSLAAVPWPTDGAPASNRVHDVVISLAPGGALFVAVDGVVVHTETLSAFNAFSVTNSAQVLSGADTGWSGTMTSYRADAVHVWPTAFAQSDVEGVVPFLPPQTDAPEPELAFDLVQDQSPPENDLSSVYGTIAGTTQTYSLVGNGQARRRPFPVPRLVPNPVLDGIDIGN